MQLFQEFLLILPCFPSLYQGSVAEEQVHALTKLVNFLSHGCGYQSSMRYFPQKLFINNDSKPQNEAGILLPVFISLKKERVTLKRYLLVSSNISACQNIGRQSIMKIFSFTLALLILALLGRSAFIESSLSLSHHSSRALVAYVPNCYILALDFSCIECNMGYYLVNQVCVLGSQNCKTFDTVNGVCTSCYVGYSFINNSLCIYNPGAYLLAGCAQISGNVCLKCSVGYYVNAQGNCEMIDTLCKVFNYEGLRCATCYPGYTYKRSTGKCAYLTYQMDNNCTLWQTTTCLECDPRYYLLGITCIESKPHCKQVNAFNICIDCFTGYVLVNMTCVASGSGNIVGSSPANTDPNCAQVDANNSCISCYFRYYLNSQKVCVAVSDQCNTFDSSTGKCLTCFGGYTLTNGSCVISTTPNNPSPDPNCAQHDASNNCISCYYRYYLNAQKVCVAISAQCNTFDSTTGNCLTCYGGYTLTNGSCVVTTNPSNPSPDPNCAQRDASNNCISCYYRYYLNAQKVCVAVNAQCNTFDSNGNCLTCYGGYTLSNGSCVVSTPPPNNTNSDPNCAQRDASNNCISCYFRYYLNSQKVCVAVSDQCNTFDSSTGKCLTCFGGYTLTNGSCVISTTPNNPSPDPNCAQHDASNNCISCYYRYYLNAQKVCVAISAQCNTFDSTTGNCLTCYGGYTLTNGSCVVTTNPVNPPPPPSDPNCAIWSGSQCLSCIPWFYYDSNLHTCQPVNILCKTFNYSNGYCTSCYPDFALTPAGGCQFIGLECAIFDFVNLACTQCISGFKIVNQTCVPI